MKNTIEVPIFNDEYKVIVCWGDVKTVRRVMKLYQYPFPADNGHFNNLRGATFYASECHPIIALPGFPKTATEIGTLAHEATHAILHIFEAVAERQHDEVFAHSIGAVVRTVLSSKKKRPVLTY